MYRAFIADDEPLVREGLKTLIDWQLCGFRICGDASNGRDALQKVLALQPDLLLLDIRMPHLDGLEVARLARENGYQGHIVILSGYKDFSYAQKAIRYRADSYLLKPIDEDELIRTVGEVGRSLDRGAQEAERITRAKDSLLADTVMGKAPAEHFSGLVPPGFFTAGFYQVFLLETDGPAQEKEAEALLHRLLPSAGSLLLHLESGRLAGLLWKPFPEDFAAQLKKYLASAARRDLFLAVGRRVDRPEELPLSYQDACLILEKRFFCGEEQLLISQELLQSSVPLDAGDAVRPDWNGLAEQIAAYILARNTGPLELKLGELYDVLRFLPESPENIRVLLYDLAAKVEHAVTAVYPEASAAFPPEQELIASINGTALLVQILRRLRDLFLQASLACGAFSSKDTVERVVRYIDAHYSQNLKLESLAQVFGYNSAYLGRCLKSRLGESFNSYLERVRVKNAMELLKDPGLKVYEVSARVGFTDLDSFYKKFRRVAGITPSEYRKQQE